MPHPLLTLVHKMAGTINILGAGGLIAAVSFHDGAIIAAAVAFVIAAILTAKAKVGTIWREDAEGQRAAKELLQEQLTAERASRAEFEQQQQELRHELKNEVAAQKMTIQMLEAKTDLATAFDKIKEMNEGTVTTVTNAIARALEERDGQIHAVLVQILDQLRSGGTA